ncbi:FG-GAP-like repeat-containing protein [Hymenobacter amundsenii]|nr:FG-GAP-like repeat-containing protein [Hymenobacter amundsenii]
MLKLFTYASLSMLLLVAASGYGQSGPIFPQPIGYGVGALYPETPRAVVTADFNRDGRLDVATANLVGNSVGVLLNGSVNTFGTPRTYPVAATPNAIVTADFDGDSYPDLATTSYGGGALSVLLNDRRGGFEAADRYPLAAPGYELAVGELTGDADPDLAVLRLTNSGSELVIFSGQGDGTFVQKLPPIALPGGEALVVADMNADGRLDVVVSNATTGSFEVLRNTGAGSLVSVGRYAGAQRGIELVVADFNGDGRPDVAQADFEGGSIQVMLATAAGFAPPIAYAAGQGPTGLASADLNADGVLDLICSNSKSYDVTVLIGSGTGTFRAAGTFAAGVEPYDLVVADFTGDGRPDVVTANFVQSRNTALTVLQGTGTGSLQTAFSMTLAINLGPLKLVQADLNNDGRPDVVTVNRSSGPTPGTVSVLLRQADGQLFAATTYAVGMEAEDLVLLDVNGDGQLDVVTANRRDASLSVLLNQAGTLTPAPSIALAGTPNGIVAADFNADGRPDLAVSGAANNSVALLLNLGNGQFASPVILPTGAYSSALTAADVDGDGRPDLAVAHLMAGTVAVLRNQGGNAQFAPPVIVTGVGFPNAIYAADLTNDNRPELLIAGGAIGVLRNNGAGVYQFETQDVIRATSLAVADLNGDGRPEVVALDDQSQLITIVGNDNGHLTLGPGYFVAGSPRSVAVANVNADGRLDLTVANYTAGAVATFLQNNPTVTATPTAATTVTSRLRVYPNPATTSIFLQLPGTTPTAARRAQLFDATGREVLAVSITDGPGLRELPVAQLPRGWYVLRVSSPHASPLISHVLLQ